MAPDTTTHRKAIAPAQAVKSQFTSNTATTPSRWSSSGFNRWSSRSTVLSTARPHPSRWRPVNANASGRLPELRKAHASTEQKWKIIEEQPRKRKGQSLDIASSTQNSSSNMPVFFKKQRVMPSRSSTSGRAQTPEVKEGKSDTCSGVPVCENGPSSFSGTISPCENLPPRQTTSPENLHEGQQVLQSHSPADSPARNSNQPHQLHASNGTSSPTIAEPVSERSASVLSGRSDLRSALEPSPTEYEEAPNYNITRRNSARLAKYAKASLISSMEPTGRRTRGSTNGVQTSTAITSQSQARTNPVATRRASIKQGTRKSAAKKSASAHEEIYDSITCAPVTAPFQPAKPLTQPSTTHLPTPSTASIVDIESAMTMLSLHCTVPSLRSKPTCISQPSILSGDTGPEYTDHDMRILYNRFGPDILRAKMAPYDEYGRINPIDAEDPWAFSDEWVEKWIPMKPGREGRKAKPVGEREVLGRRWPSWLHEDGSATYFI